MATALRSPTKPRALVLSHLIEGNRVFEDYCTGIRANSAEFTYVDYIREYGSLGKKRFEAEIEKLVKTKGIDCVFLIWWSSDLTFDIRFIERLSSQVRIVINYFDTEYFFEGVDRYYAQLADLVILPDHLSRFKYEQLGIPSLTTFALYDKNVYALDPSIDQTIDVSFIGNVKQQPMRAQYLGYLKSKGVAVESFGVGSSNGFLTLPEMVATFNRSKINLNFTTTSDSANYVVKPPSISRRIRQSKGRPNEIALSGGFILSEYAPGIEEMYAIGREIDVFRTPEQLLDKTRYYLENEGVRREMASRAHERALARYDTVAGFARVIEQLDTLDRRGNKSVYVDRAFRENYASYRFLYISYFLLNGRIRNLVEEISLLLTHRQVRLSKAYFFALKGLLLHMRAHPTFEAILKDLKNRLRIKVKY